MRIAMLVGVMLGLFLGLPFGAIVGAWGGMRFRRVIDFIDGRRHAHPRLALGLVVLFSLLLLSGCGTMAQIRLGGEATVSPRPETVLELVCASNEPAAVRYLAEPDFRLGAAAREDYLSAAREDRNDGKCKCPADRPCADGGFVELPKGESQ